MRQQNSFNLDIEKFILEWNIRYPFDRYIRKKYNILFGSPEHKALNFIDMSFEYKEDLIMKREEKKVQEEEDKDFWASNLPSEVVKTMEEAKKKIKKMSKKEVDQEFADLDISKF